MTELSVPTSVHGRVLVEEASAGPARGLLLIFHGYGQNADDAMAAARLIAGVDRWRVAAPQALHRFYTKGDAEIVASWMTRQNREDAIADNVEYVDRVIETLATTGVVAPLIIAGFSQGAAMAYRAARLGRHAAYGIVALAGDIPPEVKLKDPGRAWPPVLIGVGNTEQWYTAARVAEDESFLRSQNASCTVHRFRGGHEWTAEFGTAVGQFLEGARIH